MTQKILNILAIIGGIAMVIFGANKFLNFMPMPELTPEQMETFGAFGKIKWLMPLIGAGEVLGGLTLAYPKTRALGAIILFPVLLGIVIHGIIMDPSGLSLGGILFLLNTWVIWEHRAQYKPMIRE